MSPEDWQRHLESLSEKLEAELAVTLQAQAQRLSDAQSTLR